MICRDYDLCSECWHDGERSTHSPTHGFVKIRHKDDYYPGERLRRNPYRENNRSTTSSSVTSNRNGGNIHWNINCDGCNEENMVGIRHKCTV